MRIRKGDLDHIVDSLSDDEGDEEAGARGRAEQEYKDDQKRTRAIITAVTEGRSAAKKQFTRGKYSLDKLVSGRDELELTRSRRQKDSEGGGGEGEDEEEFDEEELLQMGLSRKAQLERHVSGGRGLSDDDDDDDDASSDDDEDREEVDGDEQEREDNYNTSEEHKQAMEHMRQQRIERKLQEKIKRR